MNIGRVAALITRHLYLYRRSFPRLLEIFYWPLLDLVVWGFITLYLSQGGGGLHVAVTFFLGALIFWDILFRAQQGIAISFLEEIWSRNLGHLFVTPLRTGELILALLFVSLIRTFIGVGGAALLAILFFDVSVFDLGLPLASFFVNLIIMGWSLGLIVSALVLRFGQGAESLGWAAIFLVQPISGVYYPISVLPQWLQPLATLMPSTHIFDGMRTILIDGVFRIDLLINASALNVLFVSISIAIFYSILKHAKINGQLLQLGE